MFLIHLPALTPRRCTLIPFNSIFKNPVDSNTMNKELYQDHQ